MSAGKPAQQSSTQVQSTHSGYSANTQSQYKQQQPLSSSQQGAQLSSHQQQSGGQQSAQGGGVSGPGGGGSATGDNNQSAFHNTTSNRQPHQTRSVSGIGTCFIDHLFPQRMNELAGGNFSVFTP